MLSAIQAEDVALDTISSPRKVQRANSFPLENNTIHDLSQQRVEVGEASGGTNPKVKRNRRKRMASLDVNLGAKTSYREAIQPQGTNVTEHIVSSPLSKDELPSAAPNKETPKMSAGSEGWASLTTKFKDCDDELIKHWNDEIDTLLVFAGLFSAILTAFNIETYKTLRQDPNDLTLILLLQISQQLSGLSNTISANVSISSLSSLPSFHPSEAAIRINTLWFSSLVCSLIVASLGMLVKQWLRAYTAGEHSSPRESARVREYRWRGLNDWRVAEIMTFLPNLLQIALVLFFIGLIDFLRGLHPSVASTVIVLIGMWMLSYIATTILPTVFFRCSYKSPQARAFYHFTRILMIWARYSQELIEALFKSTTQLSILPIASSFAETVHAEFPTWDSREKLIRQDSSLELHALVTADIIFADDDLLDSTVRKCLQDLSDGTLVLHFIRQICVYRLQQRRINNSRSLASQQMDIRHLTKKGQMAILHILIDILDTEIEVQARSKAELKIHRWMGEAFSCIALVLDSETTPPIMISPIWEAKISKILNKLLAYGTTGMKLAIAMVAYRPTLYVKESDSAIDLSMISRCAHEIAVEGISIEGADTMLVDPLLLCSALLAIACEVGAEHWQDPATLQGDIRTTLYTLAGRVNLFDYDPRSSHVSLCADYAKRLHDIIPEVSKPVLDIFSKHG